MIVGKRRRQRQATGGNHAPAQPSLSHSSLTSSGATLTGSAFSDSDVGDTHAASQWQVTTAADTGFASPVISTGDDATNKTSYAATGLSASTAYIARLRYKDSAGNYSAWSTSASFTTSAAGTTINLTLAAADDDGTSNTGTPWNNIFVSAGWYGPGSREYFGVTSFAGVTVPQAATIQSATLTVRPTALEGGAIGYNLRATAQKIANASQPSGTVNPTSQVWTFTTAQTTYSGTPTVGTDLAFDVTAVIQELVNQASWASGNRLNLVLRNNGATGGGDQRVDFADWNDVGATTSARLSITYV